MKHVIKTVDAILCEIRAVRYKFGRSNDPEVELSALRALVRTLTSERDHWKSNHDNQVIQRRNLQVEFGKAVEENVKLKEALKHALDH